MKTPHPDEITQILQGVNQGDPAAANRLLSVVYEELRKLAGAKMRHERADHTLQPTALVHEAYFKLMGDGEAKWENRAHFFGAAAESMRRILVDYARTRAAQKRGGGQARVALEESAKVSVENATELLAIDDALTELGKVDQQKCRVVELRFFGGLTVEETAQVLNISPRTVKRDWSFARAWLYRKMNAE